MEDYFVKPAEIEPRRPSRSKKIIQSFTPSTDDDDETDDETDDIHTTMSTNNTLRWQIDYNEHKNAKERMKLAGKLLDAWVSDSIKIEIKIEDCADAKEAYDFTKKRYAVTNECARDSLLNQLNGLKLEDCSSMTEYTNKAHQIEADLKTVKYDITGDMLATALLHGLPPSFRYFKEQYDWIRSTQPDKSPDLDYLYERLHVEEDKQKRLKEERRANERARKEASSNNNNFNGNPGYSNSRRPKREDKSHLKCTYPGCGKPVISKTPVGPKTHPKLHTPSKTDSPMMKTSPRMT